ncbi:GntR family transcriptional regulator [Pseudonocardia acaciae]|uniref:GntR family transcriptional regulator n=1 Tax=Pseudonocardia acaciae TaxID=551276 RepID=UPI00048BE0F4|nr:GntR family transcriptional regulator [Pseudonocardia acaciae]
MRGGGLRAANRQRIKDDVLGVLRDAIVTGVFAPGERLREAELADELEVSRGPIRDALASLEHEGLVRIEPHRGATVPMLDRRDVEEVYSLRQSLETLAARWAVEHADERDLARMEAVLAEIPAALDRGDPREVTDLDLQFHDAFYRAAHHERLYASWRSLRSQVSLFLFSRNTIAPTSREIVVDEHARILELLRQRSVDELRIAVESHLLGAYERLRERYT